MKTTIELKTKNLGTAVGTSAWVQEILKDAHLEFGKTNKENLPCIALVTKNKKGEVVKEVLAFAAPINNRPDGFQEYPQNVFALYPVENDYEVGFTGYLTPAAAKIIDSLIHQAAELLVDAIKKDELSFEFEIIKKEKE